MTHVDVALITSKIAEFLSLGIKTLLSVPGIFLADETVHRVDTGAMRANGEAGLGRFTKSEHGWVSHIRRNTARPARHIAQIFSIDDMKSTSK